MPEASGTTEKIRVVKPQAYETIPMPAPDGTVSEQSQPRLAPARSIEEVPQKETTSGIINAISTVFRVAMARRAVLVAELKALDDALAPFAAAAGQSAAPTSLSGDALRDALLRFAEEHKGDQS